MRPRVLIAAVAVAVVSLAMFFLLPRRGPAGGSESASGDLIAQTNPELSAGPKVQGPGPYAQRPAGNQTRLAEQPQNESPPVRASGGWAAVAQGIAAPGSAEPKIATAAASGRSGAQKLQQDADDPHQLAVETRVQQLLDLGMEDDPKSLQTIVSEFSNADPEIRKAAVEAAVQFGSADAIPELESAMLWAENAEQRQQIADAIDFLKLPKLTQAVSLAHALGNKPKK